MKKTSFIFYFFLLMQSFNCFAEFPFDLQRIKSHIEQKFANTSVELYPFPHIIIQDILPQDVYEYFCSKWPAEHLFDHSTTRRKRLPVTHGCADSRLFDAEQKEAWVTFGEIIVQKYIHDQMKKKFMPYLDQKFPFLNEEQLNSVRQRMTFTSTYSDGLNLDSYNYAIGPHIDQAYIFAALLIYFPSDLNHPQYGTSLYESVLNKTSIDHMYLNWAECREIKTAPYLPNTMITYLQNPKSWHGVNYINEPGYQRRSYLSLLDVSYELLEEIYGPNQYTVDALKAADKSYLIPR